MANANLITSKMKELLEKKKNLFGNVNTNNSNYPIISNNFSNSDNPTNNKNTMNIIEEDLLNKNKNVLSKIQNYEQKVEEYNTRNSARPRDSAHRKGLLAKMKKTISHSYESSGINNTIESPKRDNHSVESEGRPSVKQLVKLSEQRVRSNTQTNQNSTAGRNTVHNMYNVAQNEIRENIRKILEENDRDINTLDLEKDEFIKDKLKKIGIHEKDFKELVEFYNRHAYNTFRSKVSTMARKERNTISGYRKYNTAFIPEIKEEESEEEKPSTKLINEEKITQEVKNEETNIIKEQSQKTERLNTNNDEVSIQSGLSSDSYFSYEEVEPGLVTQIENNKDDEYNLYKDYGVNYPLIRDSNPTLNEDTANNTINKSRNDQESLLPKDATLSSKGTNNHDADNNFKRIESDNVSNRLKEQIISVEEKQTEAKNIQPCLQNNINNNDNNGSNKEMISCDEVSVDSDFIIDNNSFNTENEDLRNSKTNHIYEYAKDDNVDKAKKAARAILMQLEQEEERVENNVETNCGNELEYSDKNKSTYPHGNNIHSEGDINFVINKEHEDKDIKNLNTGANEGIIDGLITKQKDLEVDSFESKSFEESNIDTKPEENLRFDIIQNICRQDTIKSESESKIIVEEEQSESNEIGKQTCRENETVKQYEVINNDNKNADQENRITEAQVNNGEELLDFKVEEIVTFELTQIPVTDNKEDNIHNEILKNIEQAGSDNDNKNKFEEIIFDNDNKLTELNAKPDFEFMDNHIYGHDYEYTKISNNKKPEVEFGYEKYMSNTITIEPEKHNTNSFKEIYAEDKLLENIDKITLKNTITKSHSTNMYDFECKTRPSVAKKATPLFRIDILKPKSETTVTVKSSFMDLKMENFNNISISPEQLSNNKNNFGSNKRKNYLEDDEPRLSAHLYPQQIEKKEKEKLQMADNNILDNTNKYQKNIINSLDSIAVIQYNINPNLPLDPLFFDILCINCYENVKPNEVDEHSEYCVIQPDDYKDLDILNELDYNARIYKLHESLKKKKYDIYSEQNNELNNIYNELLSLIYEILMNNNSIEELEKSISRINDIINLKLMLCNSNYKYPLLIYAKRISQLVFTKLKEMEKLLIYFKNKQEPVQDDEDLQDDIAIDDKDEDPEVAERLKMLKLELANIEKQTEKTKLELEQWRREAKMRENMLARPTSNLEVLSDIVSDVISRHNESVIIFNI
jgi:hypothetical protein